MPERVVDSVAHYPIAIVQDRYSGVYSRGAWLAISHASRPYQDTSRVGFVLGDDPVGPHSDDIGAAEFWASPPDWIAVGATPGRP